MGKAYEGEGQALHYKLDEYFLLLKNLCHWEVAISNSKKTYELS
jgi:hypothetical protein